MWGNVVIIMWIIRWLFLWINSVVHRGEIGFFCGLEAVLWWLLCVLHMRLVLAVFLRLISEGVLNLIEISLTSNTLSI